MNPAALAAAIAEVDTDLLQAITKLERILERDPQDIRCIVALVHCQETLALLSSGLESLAAMTLQNGTPNPSFN